MERWAFVIWHKLLLVKRILASEEEDCSSLLFNTNTEQGGQIQMSINTMSKNSSRLEEAWK